MIYNNFFFNNGTITRWKNQLKYQKPVCMCVCEQQKDSVYTFQFSLNEKDCFNMQPSFLIYIIIIFFFSNTGGIFNCFLPMFFYSNFCDLVLNII